MENSVPKIFELVLGLRCSKPTECNSSFEARFVKWILRNTFGLTVGSLVLMEGSPLHGRGDRVIILPQEGGHQPGCRSLVWADLARVQGGAPWTC